MAIWSRDKIFGAGSGGFNSADGADGSNNNSIVPISTGFGQIFSNIVDATLTRSKILSTALYRILQAGIHKTEDRASSSDLGVSGAEPTTTKYVTVEQLPSVDKTTNDFTGSAGDGALGVTQNTIDITSVLTGTNKSFVGKLHTDFVAWLLARTRTEEETVSLVNSTVSTIIINNTRVGTISFTAHTTDDTDSRNIIIDTRTIGKSSSGADLNDDKYQTLWNHLYDKYPDAICTLNVSRTTRDADWLANRTLTLPKIYGKVLIGKDGTTEFLTIGQTGGEKTHLLTSAEAAQKAISKTLDGGTSSLAGTNPPSFVVIENRASTPPAGGLTISISGENAVTPFNVLDPYVVINQQITY